MKTGIGGGVLERERNVLIGRKKLRSIFLIFKWMLYSVIN